ncbi:MAG TPA: hypothetical protein VMB46_06650, partial [Methanomassiliicoccales archaeon]|nr:hypothetical protein [Methanomassiliicoccales archaeon]
MDTSTSVERSQSLGRVLGKRALIYIGLVVVVFALLLMLNSGHARADTTITSGDITTNTVWNGTVDGTIFVETDVVVHDGATLTITPGTVVKVNSPYSITVDGLLLANGNLSAPVTFTSNESSPMAGDWVGLSFTNDTVASQLNRVVIDYATTGVSVFDGQLSMSNT